MTAHIVHQQRAGLGANRAVGKGGADAVLDELVSEHQTAGSLGKTVSDTATDANTAATGAGTQLTLIDLFIAQQSE